MRELVVTGLPYLLPYTVHPDHIEVLRVFHDAQHRPASWQEDQ